MAFQFTAQYERAVEERMQGFYQTLSEKDRRRYAALDHDPDRLRVSPAVRSAVRPLRS